MTSQGRRIIWALSSQTKISQADVKNILDILLNSEAIDALASDDWLEVMDEDVLLKIDDLVMLLRVIFEVDDREYV